MSDKPDPADTTVVFDKKSNEWLYCQCRRKLLYIYGANWMKIQVKCGKCGKTYRVVVGVDLQIDT